MYDAIVIGAGFGGLGQSATLKHHGVENFVILEKADDLGGVWRDNTYPGVACDTQSVIYCYSYYLNLDVSAMYAPGTELHGYLKNFAEHFQLTPHLRTNAEVTRAEWDKVAQTWAVTLHDGESLTTKSLISACGQLGDPYTPDIPGLETFQGEAFHASRWRHDVDLRNKRVGSVGSAATAVQYIPEIAPEVQQLSIFQRSANYILPRDQQIFDPAQRETFRTTPETFQQLRHEIHEEREAGFIRTLRGTAEAEEGAGLARDFLEREIADPELRKKLTPDFAYGCKRILRSDDFYPALRRENVELITDSLQEVTPEGIITADGEHHELDVIIFATGFSSQKFIGDISIIGSEGEDLAERWGINPEAYYGITVDGYPNLFLVYGPNTNLNHNSIVSMLEIQHDYIARLVARLVEGTSEEIEVASEAVQRVNDEIQSQLELSSFSADCSSWYKNAEGRVINNWSGTVEDYRAALETIEHRDYAAV